MEKITLWSIQTVAGWKKLNQQGFLTGSRSFVDDHYLDAYDWMRNRMIDKIGSPDLESQYPIWAWDQHYDKNSKKPDLRRSGHLPRGTPGVRIELFKNRNEVLLSDFELWHQPLFYKGYIGKNENDSIKFENYIIDSGLESVEYHDYPLEIKKTIENSWENIFNLEFNDDYFTTHIDNKMIQACFWKLNLSDIILVDHFIAR